MIKVFIAAILIYQFDLGLYAWLILAGVASFDMWVSYMNSEEREAHKDNVIRSITDAINFRMRDINEKFSELGSAEHHTHSINSNRHKEMEDKLQDIKEWIVSLHEELVPKSKPKVLVGTSTIMCQNCGEMHTELLIDEEYDDYVTWICSGCNATCTLSTAITTVKPNKPTSCEDDIHDVIAKAKQLIEANTMRLATEGDYAIDLEIAELIYPYRLSHTELLNTEFDEHFVYDLLSLYRATHQPFMTGGYGANHVRTVRGRIAPKPHRGRNVPPHVIVD